MSSNGERDKKAEEFQQILSKALEEQGIEFLHLEYAGDEGGPILRVYIDTPTGVSLDDCQKATQIIDPIVDEAESVKEKFSLEVTSPGVDRLLFSPKDYMKFIGQNVKVKLSAPIDGQKEFIGLLTEANEEGFKVSTDGILRDISYENVKRANIIAELKFK